MSKVVLVTGATGYVATRLIPSLLARGYRVRCLVRSPEKLRNRSWLDKVEVFVGDVMNEESLYLALKGVQSAYYLIHNMASGDSYRENERIGAKNFGRAAYFSSLEHIIFLGGLGGSKENRHMQSRQETGKLLRESGVAVTEFRSSIIIGSGSISFELIRYLTTCLPFIPAPVQTNQPGQPIGIKDLLSILIFALDDPRYRGEIIEIGGPDTIIYPNIMAQFARIRRLNRPQIKIPFFPISLAAWIAGQVSPVPYEIAFPLMQELEAPSTVRVVPEKIGIFNLQSLSSCSTSLQYAIGREEYGNHLSWLGDLTTRKPLVGTLVRTKGEGFLIEHRELNQATLSKFGKRFLNGELDGKWELDDFHPGKWIRVKRNIKISGTIFIEMLVVDNRFMQTAMFEPKGIIGYLWWYCLLPIHSYRLRKIFEWVTEKN